MNTKVMKTMVGLGAAILAGLVLAESPKVMQETVTLAVNTTNSTSYIAIADTGTPEYREIDRLVVVHSSGNATGTVDLAISELGTTTSLYNTGAMTNGVIVAAWPRYPVGISSNDAPYSVKLLKVNVAQTTNLIPDVYKLTIYAK